MTSQSLTEQSTARQFLEIPSQTLLERRLLVNSTGQPTSKPDMGQVPRSSLLDKLQDFLPSMQRANADLESRLQDPAAAASLDIEHLEGGEGAPRIEMDLACGVVDLQDEAAVEAAEARLAGRNVVDPSGADAREESVSDSDSDSGGSGSIGADSGKPDSCAQGSGRSSLERFKDHPPPSAQAEADGAEIRHGKPARFDPDKRRRTATKKRRKIEEL